MARERTWVGRTFLAPGRMMYVGALGPTSLHAHHAYQIALGLANTLTFRSADGREISAPELIIPSDAPHAVACVTGAAALVYIDPEHRLGRRLSRVCAHEDGGSDWVTLAAPLSAWRATPPSDWQKAMLFIDELVAAIAPDPIASEPVHPAVTRAVVVLKQRLREPDGDLSLVALARESKVSASRLSHLFTQHMGISLRPYVLWQRMIMAATGIQSGLTLTAAAHQAGFTDSAHLTHTFHRMFGVSPSEGVGAIEWVVGPAS